MQRQPELAQDSRSKLVRALFYLFTLLLFWGIFAPWSYFLGLIWLISSWTNSAGALLLIIALLCVLLCAAFAGLIWLCSAVILKRDRKQYDWHAWNVSLVFSFGLLCFAQLLLNFMMLNFLS